MLNFRDSFLAGFKFLEKNPDTEVNIPGMKIRCFLISWRWKIPILNPRDSIKLIMKFNNFKFLAICALATFAIVHLGVNRLKIISLSKIDLRKSKKLRFDRYLLNFRRKNRVCWVGNLKFGPGRNRACKYCLVNVFLKCTWIKWSKITKNHFKRIFSDKDLLLTRENTLEKLCSEFLTLFEV